MPKDYIQVFLGVQEFSVLGWKEDKSKVVVEVIKTLFYGVCPQCGESTNKVHQYKERSIDDIPIQGKRLELPLRQRRFKCQSCGKEFTERFESIKPRSHRTIRYEQYLYEYGKKQALKDIAVEYRVKYTTLRRLWFRCAQEVLDKRMAYGYRNFSNQHLRILARSA